MMNILFFFSLFFIVSCQDKAGTLATLGKSAEVLEDENSEELKSPEQIANGAAAAASGGKSGGTLTSGADGSTSTTPNIIVNWGTVRNLYPGVQLDNDALSTSPYDTNPYLSGTSMVFGFHVDRGSLETYLRGADAEPITGNAADNILANAVDKFRIFAVGPFDTYDNKVAGVSKASALILCDESTITDKSLRIPSAEETYLYSATAISGTAEIALPTTSALWNTTELIPGKYYWIKYCLSSLIDPADAGSTRLWYEKAVQMRAVDFTPPAEAETTAATTCGTSGADRLVTQKIQIDNADPSLTGIKVLYKFSNSSVSDWSDALSTTVSDETTTLETLKDGLETTVSFTVAENDTAVQFKIVYYDNSQDFVGMNEINPSSQALYSTGPITNLLGYYPTLKSEPEDTSITSSCP